MPGRTFKLAAALVLCWCGLAGTANASRGSGVSGAGAAPAGPLGGINADFQGSGSAAAQADSTIAQALALHAKVIRTELQWSRVEPLAAGQLDPQALAYTDRLLSDASAQHIAVILLVDVTPCWASAAPAEFLSTCTPGFLDEANRYPPAQPAAFAAFVRTLAARYGNEITALEVWNEPDQANEKYFAGPEKAVRYAALLKAAYPAIKEVDPQIKVLAGSLVGFNGIFLRLLYKAGIKGFYDGLSVHFYTLTLNALRTIRSVQRANGDSAPLWLAEFGWSNCYPQQKIQEEQLCVTSAVQAANIANIFRALKATGYVAAATLYELQDTGGDHFGVINADGARKPSFAALASVLGSSRGSVSPVTLHLRRAGARVIASGSGPVGDVMRLEAFQGAVLRFRAEFALDRFNRFTLALPQALGPRGLRVRVNEQWMGAHAAVYRSI